MTREKNQEMEDLHLQAKELLKKGVSATEIIAALKKQGLDEYYAQMILNNIYSDKERKRNFWKLLLAGVFTVAGGCLINYYSYKIASNSNSQIFYLFWGIIVAGVLLIARAFILFRK